MSAWISTLQRNWTDLERGSALVVNASVVIGDITVSPTPATPVVDSLSGTLTLAAAINIPAGKTRVIIINKGDTVPVGGNFGANASATVVAGALNTELPVDPTGIELKATGTDTATNEYGTLPAITITNAAGAAIWWYAV
jgi:hypothetical protein